MDLMREPQRSFGTALIMATHDALVVRHASVGRRLASGHVEVVREREGSGTRSPRSRWASARFPLGSAWGMAGRLVLLRAVAAVAPASSCGACPAMGTIAHGRNGWYEEGEPPDVELRFDEASPDALASLPAAEGGGLGGHPTRSRRGAPVSRGGGIWPSRWSPRRRRSTIRPSAGWCSAFTGSVGLPRAELVMDPLLVPVGSAAVIFAGGAALALRVVFTMSPEEAMARIRPHHGHRPGRFSRLATGTPWPPPRIAAGDPLRTPLVSLVTVLPVGAGSSLAAASFLSCPTVMTTSTDSAARHEWDVMVDSGRPVATGEAGTLMGDHWCAAAAADPLRQDGGSGGATAGTRTLFSQEGFDPTNHWHEVSILQGRDIDVDAKNDAVLESGVARDLDPAPGDSFTIRAAGGSCRVRLVGTMSSALPGEARVPEEPGQELSGLGGRVTGVVVRPDGTGPTAESPAHELGGEGAVRQAMTESGISTLVVQSSDQVTALLWAGALMSILVAGLLVGACLGCTIIGRREEHRLLRRHGFRGSRRPGSRRPRIHGPGGAARPCGLPPPRR